ADGEPAGEPSREFRGGGDRRGGRRARVAVRVEQLRRAADATRVEEPLTVAVDDRAVQSDLVDARSLDEERTPLGEEGLERGQVEYRGAGLDLAETRVDGAGQGAVDRG